MSSEQRDDPASDGHDGPTAPAISIAAGTSDVLPEQAMLGPPPRPGLMGTIDRFEVIHLIGQGGMGAVFLAREPRDQSLVAIKLMRPELARQPRFVHRFLIEAQHMSRLTHKHILPVREVGQRPDSPYFVMPYMARGSLTGLIQPTKPLDADLCLRVAIGVAEALCFAHEKGITHRDLKPDNILLDAAGEAYLTDFGLSRTVFNDSIVDVRQSSREGTAAYMAPEIARGEAGDTRCDIYSFGALLYEMLTGHPPYEAPTQQELIRKILETEPTPIAQRQPKAQPGLATIAEGAMARDLRDRYTSMADVLADLRRVEQKQVLSGPHASGPLWLRNLWWIAAATAALMIVLVIGLLSRIDGLIASRDKESQAPGGTTKPAPAVLEDDFNGPTLDSTRWTSGWTQRSARENYPGTASGEIKQQNGAVILRAEASHDSGYSVASFRWMDSAVDLKGHENVEINLTLAGEAPGGYQRVLLTNGEPPQEHWDPASLALWERSGPSFSDDPAQVQIRLLNSAGVALVRGGADAPVRLVEIPKQLSKWHLRFSVTSLSSSGRGFSEADLRVEKVSVHSLKQMLVCGLVREDIAHQPQPGVEVTAARRGVSTKTNEYGFYELPLYAEKHWLNFKRDGFYEANKAVALTARRSIRCDMDLKWRSPPQSGRVVRSISYGPWGLQPLGCLPCGDKLLFTAEIGPPATPRGWLFELDLRDPTATPRKLVDMRTLTSRGTDASDAMELAVIDGGLWAMDDWPARLLPIDQVKGVDDARVRQLGIDWSLGLGLERGRLWFIERDETSKPPKVGLHCYDWETLRPLRAFLQSSDTQLMSLTAGNGWLWVASGHGLIYKLDPQRILSASPNERLEQLTDGSMIGTGRLAFADGHLWVNDTAVQRVLQIDVGPPRAQEAPATQP